MVSIAPPDDPMTDYPTDGSHNNGPRMKNQRSPSFAMETFGDVPDDPHYVSEFDMSVAGMHVSDALHFRNITFRPEKLTFYQVYQDRITKWVLVVFPILLLSLAAIEEPAMEGLNVHWKAAIALEVVCLIGYSCRLIHLRYCIDKRDFWMDIKNCVVVATLFLTTLDVIVWLVFKVARGETIIRFTRVLRPLLIVNLSENRNLRKLLRVIKRTVIDVVSVLVLIFLFIGIFAMMATKFFERRSITGPGGDRLRYLDDFFEAYWNLYVLMTTANSPDVGLPAFKMENAFFFFFAPFSIITTFILMNILLAVVYKHYRLHLLQEVKVDIAISQHNLQRAFKLLRDPHTDCISRDVWLKCHQKLGCSDVLQKLYWEYMVPKPEDPGISLQSFYKITDLLSSKIQVVFTRETWLEKTIPSIYNSTISCYLRYMVDHKVFIYFYDFLILVNAVALSIKSAPSYLESVFLVLFNIEIFLKIYTHGPVKFSQSTWNIYDCLVIWSASLFTLIMGAELMAGTRTTEMSIVFFDMVLTLRVLRLLKLLTSIPQLRLIISTIMQIVPSMGSFALLLLLFYYSYAIVGMEVFKGKIHFIHNASQQLPFCGNEKLKDSEFVKEAYCVLSFNSIWYSMVVLWTLTLVNQWHIITEGFVLVTNKWARIYFLSFHVIVVLIILNIFLAFVIEAFMLQIELEKNKSEEIEEHMDEMGINARKHSSLTGTSTWYSSEDGGEKGQEGEGEDATEIRIGLTRINNKIKYRRHKSAKSYNQMLIEMFQDDIQTTTGGEGKGSDDHDTAMTSWKKRRSSEEGSRADHHVTFANEHHEIREEGVREEGSVITEEEGEIVEEDSPRQGGQEEDEEQFSVGSLQDLDII